MTSSHGYYAYQDLVQTYSPNDLRYLPKEPTLYDKNSVFGFLLENNFTFFSYLFRTSKMDVRASQPQYNSTLFVCSDHILSQQLGEEFFMNLDRSDMLKIINLHTLTAPINEESLRSRRLSILQTRDPTSTITIINNGNELPLEVSVANRGGRVMSRQINCNNGIIYLLDRLLLPENF
jgi:uncharacterized surface protein with fasciclin (FAS1) repeats